MVEVRTTVIFYLVMRIKMTNQKHQTFLTVSLLRIRMSSEILKRSGWNIIGGRLRRSELKCPGPVSDSTARHISITGWRRGGSGRRCCEIGRDYRNIVDHILARGALCAEEMIREIRCRIRRWTTRCVRDGYTEHCPPVPIPVSRTTMDPNNVTSTM